jgi:hypothetical protein
MSFFRGGCVQMAPGVAALIVFGILGSLSTKTKLHGKLGTGINGGLHCIFFLETLISYVLILGDLSFFVIDK